MHLLSLTVRNNCNRSSLVSFSSLFLPPSNKNLQETKKSYRQHSYQQTSSLFSFSSTSPLLLKSLFLKYSPPPTTTTTTTAIMCPPSKPVSTTSTKSSIHGLPSSMMVGTKPVSALVPPGQCQFNDTPINVTLLERYVVSPTSYVCRFSVPDATKPLNLSTCACILAIATINDEVVVRPYTPITTNNSIGYFDLLIKHYGPNAKMSKFMCEDLMVGDATSIAFKHIEFNVKIQAPFPFQHIGMLVGGTGTYIDWCLSVI